MDENKSEMELHNRGDRLTNKWVRRAAPTLLIRQLTIRFWDPSSCFATEFLARLRRPIKLSKRGRA